MRIVLLAAALVLALGINTSSAQQKTIVQTAIDAGNFNTLVTAVKAADLVGTLSGHEQFTVFAPTDAAFAQVDPATIQSLLQPENKDKLTQVLTYHVVPGRVNAKDAYDLRSASSVNGQRIPLDFQGTGLKVGDANIVVSDIQCSNGVIHVIDAVMLPKLENIPSIATAAGQFNTLVAAVGAAGLGEVLSGPGPFTVFAPTDEAFKNLPAGTVESLLKPENKQKLIDVLKYHVVSGRSYDNDAVKAGAAQSLLGPSLNFSVSAKGIAVNEAQVLAKNIEASNGVIHVIDSVLLPTSMSRTQTMSLISSAIERGAPTFNAGDHNGCCKIYMDTLTSISSQGIDSGNANMMSTVNNTISNASTMHDMTARAWALRQGMDSLYNQLGAMPVQMRTSIR